ncbi:hypothetical protein PR048_008585 [Dryococelus australis]|uniref:Uncharacterized protein n=1 Tax=Dryococelus australis TaxID=614101 RepID=A0ABQ9HXI7_9NEOP|nr:hypothetical protein PR048_008585 [Dryococelus australis]
MQEKEVKYKPVSKADYEREFKQINLSFEKPSVDTCYTCNTLHMQIKVATEAENMDAKNEAENNLKEHQERADLAYQ